MYEHSFKTLVGNGDHIYGERGNCSWNGMLFSSKKALLLNLEKNRLGHILGDFFTNSSGHPAPLWLNKKRKDPQVRSPALANFF
jgi:hypothetical protein